MTADELETAQHKKRFAGVNADAFLEMHGTTHRQKRARPMRGNWLSFSNWSIIVMKWTWPMSGCQLHDELDKIMDQFNETNFSKNLF